MRITILVTALIAAGARLSAQGSDSDTLAPAVVQRFVDAANDRDLSGMMATVAPEAVFSILPSGEVLGAGVNSIRAFYTAALAQWKPGFSVEVARRIHDGAFVVDHEVFDEPGAQAPSGRATWVYWVRGGLIRRAWVLKPPTREP